MRGVDGRGGEGIPVSEVVSTYYINWGEPERAPHVRVVQRVRLYIYIYSAGTYRELFILLGRAKRAPL